MRRPKGTGLVKNEERVLATALVLHEAGVSEFHGFRLTSKMEEQTGRPAMSFSTLYRCLARLEERGLFISQYKAADPGSGGPPRRVYSLTGDGLEAAGGVKAPTLLDVGSLDFS